MKQQKDWTEQSPGNFVYYIASDFVDKLDEEMRSQRISRNGLAKRLGVTPGRVTQIFQNPGNLTLKVIVRCARAIGIKVALLGYYDGDKENINGPILPEVFFECWSRCGKPKNMFDIVKIENRVADTRFGREIDPSVPFSVHVPDKEDYECLSPEPSLSSTVS